MSLHLELTNNAQVAK